MIHSPRGVRPPGTQASPSTTSSSSTTTSTPGTTTQHPPPTTSSPPASPREADVAFGRWQVSVAPQEGGASPRSAAVAESKHGGGGLAGGVGVGVGVAGGLAGASQVHPALAHLLDRDDLPLLLDALPGTHRGGRYDEMRAALVAYLRHRAQCRAAPADAKGVVGERNLATALSRLEKTNTAHLEQLERSLSAYLGRLRIPLLDSRAEPEMEQLLREVRQRLAPTQAGLIVPLSLGDLGDPEEDSDGAEAPEASAFRTPGANGESGTNGLPGEASDEEDAGPIGQGGALVRSVATWHLPPQPAGAQGHGAEGSAVQAALQVTGEVTVSSSGEPTPMTPDSPRRSSESSRSEDGAGSG